RPDPAPMARRAAHPGYHRAHHGRRGAPRGLRRPLARAPLHEGADRRGAPGARGLRHRGDAPDARAPPHGGRLRAHRPRREGLGPVVGRDALHAGLPPDAVLEDRAQPEAPRAPDAARARRLPEARSPALRAPEGLERGPRGHGTRRADGGADADPPGHGRELGDRPETPSQVGVLTPPRDRAQPPAGARASASPALSTTAS